MSNKKKRKLLFKRIFVILVTLLMLLGTVMQTLTPVNAIEAIDFAGNEEYYMQKCSSSSLTESDLQICESFQDYLIDKSNKAEKELKELKGQINDIKQNITKYTKKLNEYQALITSLETQIKMLQHEISELEKEITELQERIALNEAKKEEINDSVKNRLLKQQGLVNVNSVFDFLFAAVDFSDFVARLGNLQDLAEYDVEQMEILTEIINILTDDRKTLEEKLRAVEDKKKDAQKAKSNAEELKKQVNIILAEYRKQEAALEAKKNEVADNLSEIKSELQAVSSTIGKVKSSKEWGWPVSGSAYKSAGTWHYPASFGGGLHLGLDLAGATGTKLVAPANGVVIYSYDKCANNGYLGNTCGKPSSGGNQVYMIVGVEDLVYGVSYAHMKPGTPVKAGTIVNKGDYVGQMGKSGNVTGSHVHAEVYYLGKGSVKEYVDKWNGNFSFGTGWGSTGYKNRCSNRGNVAPCRVRPEEVFRK